MRLQIAAQHLATKGRGPDTELVHMTKGEIAGLQALAVKMGGTLTINPDTGLAEAGFLRNILPMLAGAAAMYLTGGMATPFLGLGAGGVGALAGGATGYALNPKGGLGSAAMGALGGYGGGSLAGGLSALGASGASGAGTSAFGGAASDAAFNSGLAGLGGTAGTAAGNALSGAGQLFEPGGLQALIGNAAIPASQGVAATAATGLGGGMQAAKYIGAAAAPILGGMAQPTLAGMTPQSSGNIRPFSFTRNANTDDPDNPTVDQYYTAGTPMAAPGPDNYPYQPRQTIQMAEGGTVGAMPQMIQGGSGGASSGMPTYKFNRTIGGTAAEPTVDQYFTLVSPEPEFMPTGAPGFLANPVSDFGGGYGGMSADGGGFGGGTSPEGGFASGMSAASDFGGVGQGVGVGATGDVGGGYGGTSGSGDAATGDGGDGGDGGGGGYANGGILQAYKRMAAGGMSSLGSYSDGGQLLKGPGNGTSDNIPAVIGSNQPARLANNEFVIPARIVSELGNGSTDAGAKELYKMMARVQKARSKTVGKNQIAVDSKARNLLPA